MFSMLEYIRIHRISLEQDWQAINQLDPIAHYHVARDLRVQVGLLDHLIKVAEETE